MYAQWALPAGIVFICVAKLEHTLTQFIPKENANVFTSLNFPNQNVKYRGSGSSLAQRASSVSGSAVQKLRFIQHLFGRFVSILALCSGGTFALQQPVFKERYFKLVGNLLFCIRLEGTEVLSLLVLETCSVQKEDKVGLRDRFHAHSYKTKIHAVVLSSYLTWQIKIVVKILSWPEILAMSRALGHKDATI
jgi:hypothetical protein